MVLVDTSVWIGFLRGTRTAPVSALRGLLDGTEIVGVAPMILQEILQGADSDVRFETWRRYFTGLRCYVPRHAITSHIAAARMYRSCRRAGKTPRSSNDCLIAQIAIEHGLLLLHDDRDFDAIAGVVPRLRLFPV